MRDNHSVQLATCKSRRSVDQGYEEKSHQEEKINGSLAIANPSTDDKIRHEKRVPDAPGRQGQDQYHEINQNLKTEMITIPKKIQTKARQTKT